MKIALVAHDSRKKEIIEWVEYNLNELKNHKLYATGTTGKLIRRCFWENDGYPVRGWDEESNEEVINNYYKDSIICLHSGPLGGDAEIGAMIANGEIDVLIFFCDNLVTQGHQNDIYGLTRLASLYNIPFATNRTTADMILTSPLFKDPGYKRIVPDAIGNYANRKL